MIEKTLARRYAAALLHVTEKAGTATIHDTEETLNALKVVYNRDSHFRGLLHSPKVPKAVKKQLLRRILAGASPALQKFGDILIDKNRADILPEVADSYERLADDFEGIVRVKVLSAFAVTPDQEARLKGSIERVFKRKCILESKVVRTLKGGLQIHIGDEVVDGTLAYRLKSLRDKLHELQKR